MIQSYGFYKTHFKSKNTNKLEVKGWKRYSNRDENRTEVTILIPSKIHFKQKIATEDNEGFFLY